MADTRPAVGVLRVVGGLFGILAWLVFAGLQRAWRATFGWLFTTLANLLDRVAIPIPFRSDLHVFGPVSSWLRSLDHNVYALLGLLALQSEKLAVALFSRLRYALAWVGREIEGLASDLLTFALRTIYVYVPHLLKRFGIRFAQGLARAWHYIRATVPLLRRYVASIRRELVRQLARTVKRFGAFAKVEKWIARKLYGFVKSASKRLVSLERLIVPRRFRKYLAAIFPALGIAWLLSGNWIRLGKAIIKWSYDHVSAWLAYFGRMTEPQDFEDLIHHAEALVPKVLAEIDFIMSLSDPQKLAPGPPREPPA